MKNKLLLILAVMFMLSCEKQDDVNPVGVMTTPKDMFDLTGFNLTSEGVFQSNAHTTSGKVKFYTKDKKTVLVFENFKTDGGPDLKIYLSESTSINKFTDLGKLENTSGNFVVEIPTSADLTNQNYVLIWCKQFSVLFGNAQLK